MSTEDSETPAVANGKDGEGNTTPQASEPPLVRPYADIPAHMVEAPAVLTGSVREVLDSPAGADGPGGGSEPLSRFSPLRRWTARMAQRCRRHTALVVPVSGAVAVLLLTGVVLHQTGAWPFARDTGAAAPVPDARLPLPPPDGGTDAAPSGRATDDKKKPEPSKSPEQKREAGHTGEPRPSATPPSPGTPAPGEAGGGQTGSPGCAASWQVDSQWENFSATVRITNHSGQRIDGWEVSWTWNGDQRLVKHWNAEMRESGKSVTARNVDTNAEIATTGEASFGFEATGSGTPPPQLTCRVL
ncbi:hypothetical protein AN219_04460 [Streptomyces nanshensis]|nr:hypothetical protein AN219_04460 [Streptomyces nanshensis]